MFEFENHDNYFYVKASGKLTHEDYVDHLIPKLEEFIANQNKDKNKDKNRDKINALVEINELKGWELQAVWDDFSTGIKHRKEFNKIAIIADQPWIAAMVKFFSIFIPGEVKFFDLKNKDKAQAWIEKA